MNYLIIALLCMLIGAYSVELLDNHRSPILSDRLITAGLGAVIGLICSIPVMLINATF